jgi:hypothetical protein
MQRLVNIGDPVAEKEQGFRAILIASCRRQRRRVAIDTGQHAVVLAIRFAHVAGRARR